MKDEALRMALEALKEMLAAERATNRPPETVMQAEQKLDRIRKAAKQSENAITAIEQVLANDALDRMADNERELGIQMQPEPEPVAWRDHVEQRLLTWRQSFVNKSGDQLALEDFMDKRSLDDLIDFVCDEYTPPPKREWQGLTEEEWGEIEEIAPNIGDAIRMAQWKLKEKNT